MPNSHWLQLKPDASSVMTTRFSVAFHTLKPCAISAGALSGVVSGAHAVDPEFHVPISGTTRAAAESYKPDRQAHTISKNIAEVLKRLLAVFAAVALHNVRLW